MTKVSFGSEPRFSIHGRGSRRLIVLNVKASRVAQARWSAGIWKRIVHCANADYPEEKDVMNVLWLMSELGWSARALSIWGGRA